MWITHDGKGAPDLPPGTQVYVRFRGCNPWGTSDPWEHWCPDEDDEHDYWTFSEDESYLDIVAYRIAT